MKRRKTRSQVKVRQIDLFFPLLDNRKNWAEYLPQRMRKICLGKLFSFNSLLLWFSRKLVSKKALGGSFWIQKTFSHSAVIALVPTQWASHTLCQHVQFTALWRCIVLLLVFIIIGNWLWMCPLFFGSKCWKHCGGTVFRFAECLTKGQGPGTLFRACQEQLLVALLR